MAAFSWNGLQYRSSEFRESLSFTMGTNHARLLLWRNTSSLFPKTISTSTLCSIGKHCLNLLRSMWRPAIFSKGRCCLYLPRLLDILILLKRESRAKGSQDMQKHETPIIKRFPTVLGWILHKRNLFKWCWVVHRITPKTSTRDWSTCFLLLFINTFQRQMHLVCVS